MSGSFIDNRTCETCKFRAGYECRKFPPNQKGFARMAEYPIIQRTQGTLGLMGEDYKEEVIYQSACWQYQEGLQ